MLISEKTQNKLFWIGVFLAIVIVTLDCIAIYNMKPDLNSVDPYNTGCKAAAVFLAVFFGIGIFASSIYYLTHKIDKVVVGHGSIKSHVKHKKKH